MSASRPSLIATAALLILATGGMAWMNFQARPYSGMSGSAGSVGSVGWQAQPRTEYGWPITIIRVFKEPSDQTAPGRFDVAGLVVNVLCWTFVAAVCCTPILIGRYLRTADRLRSPKNTSARAQPAKSFEEHLQDQKPDEGI